MVDKGRNILLVWGAGLCLISSSLYASYPETLDTNEISKQSAPSAAGSSSLGYDNSPSLSLKTENLAHQNISFPEDPVERAPYHALGEKIIALTGAIHDVRREVQERLTHTLFPHIEKNGALRGGWNTLWPLVLDPEALVDNKILREKGEEEGFKLLNKTLTEINTFKQTLLQLFPHEPSIQPLDLLKDFYHSFKDQCLANLNLLRQEKSSEARDQFDRFLEPKALLMGELWPHQFYRISQSTARHILHLNEYKEPLSEMMSAHRVSSLPVERDQDKQIYFKNDGRGSSLNPSREYMFVSLYHRLKIQVPVTTLLVLNHVKFFKNYSHTPYFIQASTAVQGIISKGVLEDTPSFLIDEDHFSRQVIGAFLTSPVDGSPNNFVVTPLGNTKQGWVSIDNDEVFKPPLRADSIHLKSVLFLLPLMDKPLSEEVSTFFKNLSIPKLILEWLKDLEVQEQRYETFKRKLVSHYSYRKDMKEEKTHIDTVWEELGLPFKSFTNTLIPTLESLLFKIQMALSAPVTHDQLFITCYPNIGLFYQNLRKEYTPSHASNRIILPHGGCATLSSKIRSQSPENRYYEDSEEEKLKRINNSHLLRGEVTKYLSSLPLRTLSSSEINDVLDLVALHWRSLAPQLRSVEWQEPRHLLNYVQRGSLPSVLEMMVRDLEISVHTQDEDNRTLLHLAPGSPNEGQKISALIALGADLEAFDRLGSTPLDIAAEREREEAFTSLIEKGAGKKANIHKILFYYRELSASKRETLYPFLRVTNPKLAWEIALEALYSPSIRDTLIKVVGEGNKYLPDSLKRDIFDDDGKILKTNKHGRRAVPHLKRGIYETHLKLYPELPGMEIAVSALIRALGYEAPYSKLAELRGLPVLLTQTIPGQTLYDVLHNSPELLKKLDPAHLSMAFVMAMVMNPEDGNPTNYIVSPYVTKEGEVKYKIISIDHDHSFMPAVAKEIKGPKNEKKKSLQVKTILYCMEEMNTPVHSNVISHFKSLNPIDVLKPWLESLKEYDQQIKSSFKGDTVLALSQSKDTVIGIPFTPGMIVQLYTKLVRLQVALAKDEVPTHFDLLRTLEPYLGYRYVTAYKVHSTLSLWERFKKIDGAFYQLYEGRGLYSTASLREVLDSASVPHKEELQRALWRNEYGPLQALSELRAVEEQHVSLQQILSDLQASDSKKFENLRIEGIQESLLEKIDFKILSLNQQKVLIENLKGQEMRTARFLNANGLTDDLLRSLTFSHLTTLILRGCNELNYVNQKTGWFRSTPLTMPMLRMLNMLECSNLLGITLQAPLLEDITLSSCIKFKNLSIEAGELKKICLKNLEQFDEEGLISFLTDHLIFTGLRVENCPKIVLYPATPFNKENYKIAQERYKQALKGGAFAQLTLGFMYGQGRGVVQDYAQAVEWYKKSAAQNNVNAQFNLGFMYENGRGVIQDYTQAVELYRKAAAQNNPEAQCNLGLMYERGRGVAQDYGQAVEWYRRAAAQSNANAQFTLGCMYENGLGVAQDYGQAVEWYQKAAAQNYENAQYRLGFLYAHGRGVVQDYGQALEWYRKTAAQNNAFAQSNLGFFYENGLGVAQDYGQAVEWYQKAAAQNHALAQCNLGCMYENGLGVAQDYGQAVEWYQKAAAQNHALAQFNLGCMCEQGLGVAQDYGQAVAWFKKAAEQQLPLAYANLGILTLQGKIGLSNEREAQLLFEKAYKLMMQPSERVKNHNQRQLGLMYRYGWGVKQDFTQAHQFLKESCNQQDYLAMARHSRFFKEGWEVAINSEEALRLLRVSVEHKDPLGQYNLGLLYLNGEGVSQNNLEALRLFQFSAKQMCGEAQYMLGWMYEQGLGVEIDTEQSRYWYQEAHKRECADALYSIGRAYEYGLGVPQDLEKAIEWYQKAASLYSIEAKEKLAILIETKR